MEPFGRLSAIACALPEANIDTDQIVPARFMSTPRSAGYGGFLLHDRRRGHDGQPTGQHPLDQSRYSGAQIIVARRNFGCGSSRVAAVYALMDFGIRCVIAPSFGEIFAGNSLSNGLLAARVSDQEADQLIAAAEDGIGRITVDLEEQTIRAGAEMIGFAIDPPARLRLLNGWDDITMTNSFKERIDAFQAHDRGARPWSIPTRI